ncbi:heterokaryon incompatibility protein-domain-containing protein [Tricladium varicosporioides]|nr:heterokaryon incompatibility protein-domain-containing protein [Hymenoscyphus varicosporioides]
MGQLTERFDLILGCIDSKFPNGLPKEALQSTPDTNTDKVLENLDPATAKFFQRELKFAGGLRSHDLARFLNSPATDTINIMPEGRAAPLHGKSTKFEYEPLDYSTDASRLVVLRRGQRDDEIKCNLVPLPLSVLEAPDDKTIEISRYEALSYVWGPQKDPFLIDIDSQDFPIGRNLYSALIHLRLEGEDRLLWIDAICINQDDIQERNWQVSRMGLIYRSALQTVAWLGPATWGSDMACLAIQAFQKIKEGNAGILEPEQRSLNTSLFGSDDNSSPPSDVDESLIHIIWDQFDQLFERAFFSRSWIVQEIVLARHVTVYCGSISFSYGMLVLAFTAATELRKSLGFSAYTPLKTGFTKFFTFFTLCLQLRDTETDFPIFHLASRFGRLLATDPRDKIYSFLSLSSELIQKGTLVDHGFYPNYEKSNLDVHRDFTVFCIQRYNNLDILSRPYKCEQRVVDYESWDIESWAREWPSWVPDWDRRGIKEIQDFRGIDSFGRNVFREFNAAGWWEDVEVTGVGQNGRTIMFAGVEFDKIVAVVDADLYIDPRSVSGGEEQCIMWESFALQVGNTYGETAEEREEAFWRTLVADSDGRGDFAPQEFGKMFRCWRSNEPPSRLAHTETELYKGFVDQLFNTARGRRIFLTERGYLGIGSWEIGTGDSISILKGGKVPIVGRASGLMLEKDVEDEGVKVRKKMVNVYSILGSGGTYVHGLMDGEAVGIVEDEGLDVTGVLYG